MGTNSINARILKATTIFGGLQGASIICSVVRVKLVAIWIGAAGIGLFGLLNSALMAIFAFTQLGLRQSAVRELAASAPSDIPSTVCAVRRWGLWLGMAGAILTLASSPWLSEFTFGSKENWWMFAILSATVVMSALNNCEGAVFQGLQRFRKLAVCSLAGTLGGLALSIPMFYIWRIDSIVPSFIAYFACTWIAMGLYREKVPAPVPAQPVAQTIAIGRRFMTLGIYITATELATNLISFIFMSYLNKNGTLGLTGFYNAGFTMLNSYAGLLFYAISMEYFPRLSTVKASKARTSLFVTNQLYVSLSIIVPVATVFITASGLAIRILYSSEFLVLQPFVVWGSTGIVFRAVALCMSYVILARGDGRTFIVTELLSGAISLLLNITGYRIWGFAGLGYAYIGWYLCYTAIIATVYFRLYRLRICNRRLFLYGAYGIALTALTSAIATAGTTTHAIPCAIAACLVAAYMLKRIRIGRK